MSAIASVTILPKSVLPALRDAATPQRSFFGKPKDAFREVLAQHGRPVGSYEWSGYVLVTLLPYLEESRGLALMKSEFNDLAQLLAEERAGTYFFLTHEHKKWLSDLEPAKFIEQELCDYYNEFNETEEADAGRPMLDGVVFLQQAVAAVDADVVGLLSIG